MKKLTLPVACLCLALFSQCNKDYNAQGPYTSVEDAMAEVAAKSKTVIINAETGGTFYGYSGSRYEFGPSAFKSATGEIIKGDVEVTATEYLGKSDMLFSDVLPTSPDGILISGGESNTVAKQNGQDLKIAPGKTYTVTMPQKTPAETGMQVFLGTYDSATKTTAWRPTPTDTATGDTIKYIGDSLALITSSTHLCNADKFMTNPIYQEFNVNFAAADGSALTSVRAYAMYDNYNGMWEMKHITNNKITEGHVPNIKVHFVVMGIVKGNFYGGILAAAPKTGSTYTVTLSKTTAKAFKTTVDAL